MTEMNENYRAALAEEYSNWTAEDEDLMGPMPPVEKVVESIKRNDQRIRKRAIEAIKASFESGLFALTLGVTEEKLREMEEKGEVIGFKIGSTHFYPTFQVTDEGLIDGIGQLPEELGGDASRFIYWSLRPSRILGGEKPADVLQRGEKDRVLRAARYSNPYNNG